MLLLEDLNQRKEKIKKSFNELQKQKNETQSPVKNKPVCIN